MIVTISKYFRSENRSGFHAIDLRYSAIGADGKWFCRVWRKDWINYLKAGGKKEFGQSYGKNKFEAFRLAVTDLNK